MKSIFYLVIIAIVLVSCSESGSDSGNTTGQSDTAADDTTQMTIQIPTSTCYRYATASDTIYLKVEKFPNVVTGQLEYKLKEKDKNTGEIDGVLRGDTLVADYTFMSEGTRSVRQVVFLVKNNTAIEGYGEMQEEAGKMVFKDITSINFSKGLRLVPAECELR